MLFHMYPPTTHATRILTTNGRQRDRNRFDSQRVFMSQTNRCTGRDPTGQLEGLAALCQGPTNRRQTSTDSLIFNRHFTLGRL